MLEEITLVIMAIAAVAQVTLIALVMLSQKLRLRLVRGFLADWSKLTTFSEMGKTSAEVRIKQKVENKLTELMPKLISQMLGANPAIQIGLDFIMKSEIGDWIREDERIFPLVIAWFAKNAKSAQNLLPYVEGFLAPQQLEGNPQNKDWWNQ